MQSPVSCNITQSGTGLSMGLLLISCIISYHLTNNNNNPALRGYRRFALDDLGVERFLAIYRVVGDDDGINRPGIYFSSSVFMLSRLIVRFKLVEPVSWRRAGSTQDNIPVGGF